MKKKLIYGLCVGIFAVGSMVPAEEKAPKVEKRKPIVVQYKTLQGITYHFGGKKLGKLSDYQAIISPIKDVECDRLLRDSGVQEDAGAVILVLGSSAIVTGLIVGGTDPNRGPLDGQQTAGLITGLAGLVADYVGIFKIADSMTSKFAAVQRYNAIIHGDDLNELTLQKRGIQADLLAFRF